VRRSHINLYLKEVMGRRFSAKDFRTWAGTLICACALAKAGVDREESKAARKRKLVEAVRTTAERLGNSPAVCRSSYISPAVVEGFNAGRVVEARFSSIDEILAGDVAGLRRCEKALLEMLGGKRAAKTVSRRVPRSPRRAAA